MMEQSSISTHYFARRLWMAIILCGAIVLSAGHSTTPAHADPGYAYYWSITFDFEQGFNGVLSIATGYNENGAPQDPPIYVQNTTIPCQRVGNASVSGGVLTLNGGYVTCDFDLRRALESAFEMCNQKVAGCGMRIQDEEYYAHFRAAAQVMSTLPGEAPIFYHEDASYRIYPSASGSTGTQITADLTPHGVTPSTQVMVGALGVWTSYQSFYSCGAACNMGYSVGGHTEIVATTQAKVPFSTQSTRIYIGHDPEQGLTAPAGTQINTLFVDPPNHGNHN
jgi:hypothetical protein